jgi:uncharacterized membrane protein YidH (DUF202 family)
LTSLGFGVFSVESNQTSSDMNTLLSHWSFYKRIPTEIILSVTSLAIVLRAVIGTPDWSATCLGLTFFLLLGYFVAFHSAKISASSLHWSRTKLFIALAGFSGVLSIFVTFAFLDPSHAQLLEQTSAAICSAFTSAGGTSSGVTPAKTAIKAVFWILRGMIILWMAFVVFQVVQNRDDQEKMQQIVRTPVMILLGTVVCDVASLFVIGTAGAGC